MEAGEKAYIAGMFEVEEDSLVVSVVLNSSNLDRLNAGYWWSFSMRRVIDGFHLGLVDSVRNKDTRLLRLFSGFMRQRGFVIKDRISPEEHVEALDKVGVYYDLSDEEFNQVKDEALDFASVLFGVEKAFLESASALGT